MDRLLPRDPGPAAALAASPALLQGTPTPQQPPRELDENLPVTFWRIYKIYQVIKIYQDLELQNPSTFHAI
jgi:hypothetical protein